MGDPFTTDFKIATREPSFVLQNTDHDDGKLKAHSSSMYFVVIFQKTFLKQWQIPKGTTSTLKYVNTKNIY